MNHLNMITKLPPIPIIRLKVKCIEVIKNTMLLSFTTGEVYDCIRDRHLYNITDDNLRSSSMKLENKYYKFELVSNE